MGEPVSLLLNIFIYLLVALLVVPGAKRIGMGPVLGYLLAGVVIGPWGLALIRDAQHIELLSSVATVFLLFLIALQATPERIRMLRELGLLGLSYYGLTALVILIVALMIGLPFHHALLAGLCLSLSSGALAHDAFKEHYPTGSPLTDTGKRLLLTQSLLVLPVVVLLPLFAFEAAITDGSPWPRVVMGTMLLAVFGFFGHWMLKHAFRYVVSVGLDEVFVAFTLVLVIGLLLLVQWLQLPIELAAFLAGLLLVRSEYGSAVHIALRPFTGLLVGLFFVSAGMEIDFGTFIRKPLETLALVALLMAVKIWVLRNVLRWSSVPRRQRVWLATVLSQGGELALIVLSLAVSYKAMPEKLASQLILVVALSMLTTPILLIIAERRDKVAARKQANTGLPMGETADSQVIVAGFGRVGQVIARLLKNNGFRVAIIDNNPDRFQELRAEGFVGFYGDAARPDLLSAAGALRAAVMVIAVDDPERAAELVQRLRRDCPAMTLVCRAFDTTGGQRLLEQGADRVYRETIETALLMGEDVLELVGVSPLDAQALTESFRDAEDSS
ncbi:MAG: cation:proton antiporter [Granulosicoccus sp.]